MINKENGGVCSEIKSVVKVSIIISVYNTEDYLAKCLDSLVEQTLQEIEIIAVDNGSTDGCNDILAEYKDKLGERFIVITLEKNTGDPSTPWNMGIQKAHGKYISIVDSDDWCAPTMFEDLYEMAEREKVQMVISDHYEVFSEDNSVLVKCNFAPGVITIKQLLMNPHMAPWGKIVLRDVYIVNHLEYKSQIHCDTGLNLIMYSMLESAAYLDEPLYFYNHMNPNSETNTKKRMKQATIVDTLEHILAHYNTKWEQEVIFSIMRFFYWFCFSGYVYHQDVFVPFVRKHAAELKRNRYLSSNREGLKTVLSYLKKDLIPKRFICASFGKKDFSEMEKSCIKSWNDYTIGYETIILNEKNCNISENPVIKAAYERKNYLLVNAYFTLKELYKTGGFGMSASMKINAPIGEMRMHNVVLGFISKDKIGGGVIGCKPHQKFINFLIKQLETEPNENKKENEKNSKKQNDNEFKLDTFEERLNDAIKIFAQKLQNGNYTVGEDVFLMGGERLYYNIQDNNLMERCYEYTYHLSPKKPFIILHEQALKSYIDYILNLEQKCECLSQEVNRLSNSRSWRYTAPLRYIVKKFKSLTARLTRKRTG